MSDGTPCADTRMMNWIASIVQLIGNQFLGVAQPVKPNNGVIQNYVGKLKTFLQPLEDNEQITTYSVAVGANTVTTIEQGFLIGSVSVQTLAGIRYVLTILQVGVGVQVTQAAA
jgi:hypothetical protein